MHKIHLEELSRNRQVILQLLTNVSEEMYLWKSEPKKWCLLEIICHLYDEEREDFRARTKHILTTPLETLPSIDPAGWVHERNYMNQDYAQKLQSFLNERDKSIEWLQSLQTPIWDNAYQHPNFGPMTAKMFLSNWLAHDYLHIRQITKIKFDYLQHLSNESLTYAGEW